MENRSPVLDDDPRVLVLISRTVAVDLSGKQILRHETARPLGSEELLTAEEPPPKQQLLRGPGRE
jgi:hypothetical protein